MGRLRCCSQFAIALFFAFVPVGVKLARAQPVSSRLLEGISFEQTETDVALRIRFDFPIFYLRHTPIEQSDSLDIQLKLIAVPAGDRLFRPREAIQVPPSFPLPVQSVTLEMKGATEPVVEVRFSRVVHHSVEQGEDLRSLVVRVPREDIQQDRASRLRAGARDSSPLPVPPGPGETEATPERAELMQEGRRALTAKDYDRATALFTKLLSLPEGPDSPQALELLALSRERKGQLAHAKAEYERYLERYPSDPGAGRVRQRLEALVTARAEPAPRRPPPTRRPEHRPLDFETFGSLYAGYRYAVRQEPDFGDQTLDSSLFTDVHQETRLDFESWSLRNQFTGGYRYPFLAGADQETRVSALFVEAETFEERLVGSVGRRSKSTGGVLGRYDGGELSFRATKLWSIGVVGGLPVDRSSEFFEGFDRYFGGINTEIEDLFGVLDVELFAIAQMAGNFVDRVAVGSELRYFGPGRSIATFLDYDVYYQSLNTAHLVASWQPVPTTYLTLFADYRNTPTLTTRNALQGQDAIDLDDLERLFSQQEIEQIARDRTVRSANASLSATQILTDRLQLALNVGGSHLSDIPASGGLDAIPGTGFEFNYSAQLIANDVLEPGDVGVIGLRFFDGSNSDIVSATLSVRYPVTDGLRLTPRFQTDYRMQDESNLVVLLPSLRLDLDFWLLNFDMEAGAGWDVGGREDGVSYFGALGLRYDF